MKNNFLLVLLFVTIGGFIFSVIKQSSPSLSKASGSEERSSEGKALPSLITAQGEALSPQLISGSQPVRRFNGRVGEGKRKQGDLIFKENGIKAVPSDFFNYREGDTFSWEVVDGFSYTGKIFTYAQKTESSFGFSAYLDNDEGRLVFSQNEWGIDVRVYYNGRGLMHMFRYTEGEWTAIETHLSSKLCADLGAKYPVVSNFKARAKREYSNKARLGGSTNGVINPPVTGYIGDANFQSKPGSSYVIYLDFDGETNLAIPEWADPSATPPVPAVINVTSPNLSAAFIHYVMCAVAEDFAPFDVNVTNVRSVYENTPSNRRTMCLTTTDTLLTDGGGVAQGDSFVLDSVCWNSYTEVPSDCADTISHEVGHQLGLDHDGSGPTVVDNYPTIPAQPSGIVEYYKGHINGKESWAPIMGSGIGFSLAQWSKLEYKDAQQYWEYEFPDGEEYYTSYDASEVEDDFVVVTENGLPLMSDDHGNSFSNTTDFVVNNDSYTVSGILGANNDVDAFKLTFNGLGTVNILAGSPEIYSNLDVKMKIYDASQSLIHNYDNEDYRTANYETNLQPGTYYITLEGDGVGNPQANSPSGYTKYGSVGYYDLTVTPNPVSDGSAVEVSSVITHSTTPVPWQRQAQIAHDGVDAMQAGRVGHGQSSSFSFTSNTASISFWYKVSSEIGSDSLTLYIDGIEDSFWSGEVDWTQYAINNLSAGTHTFRFEYKCDVDTTSGFNSAWIDQIQVDDQESLAQWFSDNNLASNASGNADNDSYSDIIEYVAGSDPNSSTSKPVFCINPDTGVVEFTRDTSRKGTITRLLISEDLTSWEVGAVSYDGEPFYMRAGVTGLLESGSVTSSKIDFQLNDGSETRFGRYEFLPY